VNTIEPGAVGLPSNLIAGSVGWSPDGASLILDGDIRGVTHMFRIDLARPVFVDITPGQIYGRSPTWSSSGDIAFIPFDQTQWGRRPWVMSSTGQGARPLLSELPDEMRIDGITWTPDGQRLVIAASNGNQRIYIVDRDGSHLTRLVSALPYPYLAGSSPDGRHLLLGNFLGALDDEMQVYLADTEDDGLGLLMRNAEPLGYSPDGGAILVATPACAWDMRTLNKCDQSVVQIDPATAEGRPLVSADRMDALGASNDHEGLGWSLWRAVYHQTKATNRGTTH
jgi:hypothetical protein